MEVGGDAIGKYQILLNDPRTLIYAFIINCIPDGE